MKTIALSMIFSLAVIVCEQQTLFAPHYTDLYGRLAVTSKTSPQNSLVPVAGVNRSVPLAGTGDSLIAIIAIAAAKVDKDPSTSTGLFRGCVPMDTDSDDSGLGKMSIHGDEDQPFDYDLGPIDDNGAFLPWHRGYISSKTGRN